MGAAFVAGFLVGLSAAVLAGGAAMIVMETSVREGFGVAMAAGAGIATGDAMWASVAVAAGAGVKRLLAPWSEMLQWLAVGVLLVIGVVAVGEVLRPAAARPAAGHEGSPVCAYGEFLAFTLIDPVTIIFFLSLIVGAGLAYPAAGAAVFVAGAFVASLSWQLALVTAGRRLRREFSGHARRRIMLLDCALLALFAVYVALGLYRN